MKRLSIALFSFLLCPLTVCAGDPISMDMEGRKEFLKGQFSETYFVNLQTPEDERKAMDKSIIHVVAVAVAANAPCGLDVDVVDLEAKARQMGLAGPLARDFFSEIKDSVAKDIAEQLADDEGGVCDGIYYTVEKALPLVRGRRPGGAEQAVSQTEPAAEMSNLIVAPSSGERPDIAQVPVLYDERMVRAPIRYSPEQPDVAGIVDYERMILDPQFDGQDFPDFVCPPSEQRGCELLYGADIQQLKDSVVGLYEPTEELCRQVRIKVAMNSRAGVAASLNTIIFILPLASAGPGGMAENSTAPLAFNPMIYHLVRMAMASQVCLGVRQL